SNDTALDTIHVQGYGKHDIDTHPGPISPRGWISGICQWIRTIAGMPKSLGRNKIFVLMLPNYGLAGVSVFDRMSSPLAGLLNVRPDCLMPALSAQRGDPSVTDSTMHELMCPLNNGDMG